MKTSEAVMIGGCTALYTSWSFSTCPPPGHPQHTHPTHPEGCARTGTERSPLPSGCGALGRTQKVFSDLNSELHSLSNKPESSPSGLRFSPSPSQTQVSNKLTPPVRGWGWEARISLRPASSFSISGSRFHSRGWCGRPSSTTSDLFWALNCGRPSARGFGALHSPQGNITVPFPLSPHC